MLVRKLKCHVCGANKINEISTSYIYCDYCGSFMGMDMTMMVDEVKDVFSMENYTKPLQQQYQQVSIKVGEAMKNKDRDAYVQAMVDMHEVEFQLFPKRFGPKIKQPAYIKKYLTYYKAYYNELMDGGFFEKNAERNREINEHAEKLKYEIVDGKVNYEMNDDFNAYIEYIKKFIDNSVQETMSMSSLKYYPEQFSSGSKDIMEKMAYGSYVQQMHPDNINKVIDMLGLKTEFIDIDPVPVTETQCLVCNSTLKVPEGSETIVCENCGTVNKLAKKEIQCMNCSAPYEKNDKNECPFCGSKMMAVGSTATNHKESQQVKDQKATKPKKSKGLFGKLFGS